MELLGNLETAPDGLQVPSGKGGSPDPQVLAEEAFMEDRHYGAAVRAREFYLRSVRLGKQVDKVLKAFQGILITLPKVQNHAVSRADGKGRPRRLDIQGGGRDARRKNESGVPLRVLHFVEGDLLVSALDAGQFHFSAGRNVSLGIGHRGRKDDGKYK